MRTLGLQQQPCLQVRSRRHQTQYTLLNRPSRQAVAKHAQRREVLSCILAVATYLQSL